jgi:Eukaryotic cytochrome b561
MNFGHVVGDRFNLVVDFAAGTAKVGFLCRRICVALALVQPSLTLTLCHLLQEPFDLRVLHGIMMSVCWGFLVIVSVLLARFGKGLGHCWYLTHAIVNATVILVTIAAAVIGIVHVEKDFAQDDLWARFHGILGMVVTVVTVFQAAAGWWADRKYDEDRDSVPIWPDRCHCVTGFVILVLAYGVMYLGVQAFGIAAPGGKEWMFGVLAASGGVSIVVFLILSCIRCRKNKDDSLEMY